MIPLQRFETRGTSAPRVVAAEAIRRRVTRKVAVLADRAGKDHEVDLAVIVDGGHARDRRRL